VSPELLEHRLAHRVRVVHGGTGRPYERIDARLTDPAWPHWRLRVRGADVVLSADARRLPDEPATTTVAVQVTDLAMLERFADGGATTVALARGDDEAVTLTLEALPDVLEVRVVDADGKPRTGRTVTASGKDNGHVVPLPAADAGVYRSAATAWEPARQPYVIHVNDQRRGTVAFDYARPLTRIQVVDL
jgi:hypothetical protein